MPQSIPCYGCTWSWVPGSALIGAFQPPTVMCSLNVELRRAASVVLHRDRSGLDFRLVVSSRVQACPCLPSHPQRSFRPNSWFCYSFPEFSI